jgi:hypothetical protein
MKVKSGDENDVKDHSDGKGPVEEKFEKDLSHHVDCDIFFGFLIEAFEKFFNQSQHFCNGKGIFTFKHQFDDLEKVQVVKCDRHHDFAVICDQSEVTPYNIEASGQ